MRATQDLQTDDSGGASWMTPVRRASAQAIGLAVVAIALACAAPSSVRVACALAACAITVVPLVSSSHQRLNAALTMGSGVVILGFAGGGLAQGDVSMAWEPLAAVAAYPLFGRALLHQVSEYRLVRRSDLLVEGALIGTAVAIVLQAAIDWRRADAVVGSIAGNGISALLVGLDVGLVVLASWSLRIRHARRGPLGLIATGFVAIFAAHMISAVRVGGALDSGAVSEWMLATGVLAIAAAATYTTVRGTEAVVAVEPPLFSRGHATLVVLSLLAAPTVLAIHSLNGIMVSATIATGTALSGLVLANYLVELLRERAAGEHQATHDALTDLPNRMLFVDRLERAIAHAERASTPVGLLYIDLDRFKEVNDTLGHRIGDDLLRETAARLREATRHEDTVARLGGDEFAVLLPHIANAEDGLLVAERILHALYEPLELDDHVIRSAASIGAAVFPHDAQNPVDLVSAADDAMYEAKEHTGPAIVVATRTEGSGTSQLQIESELRTALERDELVLHYQPIVDARSERVVGAEALIRWQHPERGFVSPGDFIPVAERSDLIVDIGNWVVHEACREQVRWARLGWPDAFITVNISARHFNHDLVSTMTAALRATGADPTRLVIEITESAAARDVDTVAERLGELRRLGLCAAIDDFGTGYSGMQYVADLPVDILKIDRSFVSAGTPRAGAVIVATIAMAHSLGLTVVAEGVETEAEAEYLGTLGCDRLQGFYFGRPSASDAFIDQCLSTPVYPRPTIVPA